MSNPYQVVIIGAGPAGLSAAYQLAKRGIHPVVLEQADRVGGLARTEDYKGYRFDIGGHRFFTDDEQIQHIWNEMLRNDLLKVTRLSHIYYRNQFLKYPIEPFNVLSRLGFIESLLIALSYLQAQVRPYSEEKTFEQWVSNRFGRRLYRTFFQTYTEKVWGIPCNELQAEWAAQRIQGLSLRTALTNLLFHNNTLKTLITEFFYPVLGPGMMWESFQQAVESMGGEVHLNAKVVHIERQDRHIQSVTVRHGTGMAKFRGDQFISTLPLRELMKMIDPSPPDRATQAASRLKYRAFVLVGLIVNRKDLFKDNWIYVHNEAVTVARIQNFKNWSAALVPDRNKTSLGMEYFCSTEDKVWRMSDSNLIGLAASELETLGLAFSREVLDGVVFRESHAYPVYDPGYRENLETIQDFLATIANLQTIGRSGMHRYNNMDHSMLMGIQAAESIRRPW